MPAGCRRFIDTGAEPLRRTGDAIRRRQAGADSDASRVDVRTRARRTDRRGGPRQGLRPRRVHLAWVTESRRPRSRRGRAALRRGDRRGRPSSSRARAWYPGTPASNPGEREHRAGQPQRPPQTFRRVRPGQRRWRRPRRCGRRAPGRRRSARPGARRTSSCVSISSSTSASVRMSFAGSTSAGPPTPRSTVGVRRWPPFKRLRCSRRRDPRRH